MQLYRSRFIRHGLPLLALVVLGSFGLSEFTSIRVQKRDEKNRMLSAEETLRFQKKVQRVDVEEEYQKICKELDLDSWENKRLPRPPETVVYAVYIRGLKRCQKKQTTMLVSYRDKATFSAHQSYLRSRGKCAHVMHAAHPRARQPLDFTPKNHPCRLRSPKMEFRTALPPVTVTHEAVPAVACTSGSLPKDQVGVEFTRSFRGKKPRDSLPNIARRNRAFLEFPFSNPKPHNFRPLDDRTPDMQLRRLKTPDPLNLHLKLHALSGDHKQPYNSNQAPLLTRHGQFHTLRTPSPAFSRARYFPKERYDPAFSAHDALLDRIVCTLTTAEHHIKPHPPHV